MKEMYGNIWKLSTFNQSIDGICITTNGFVKKDGACVMGRGIALEAKTRFPRIEYKLGEMITQFGNHVHPLMKVADRYQLISFPTKHIWMDNADIKLIQRSCRELLKLADEFELKNVLLPRPGVGNGKLSWEDVKPAIVKILDDRITVVTF